MPPILRQQESGDERSGANVVDNSLAEMEPTWLSSPPPPPLRFSSYSLLEVRVVCRWCAVPINKVVVAITTGIGKMIRIREALNLIQKIAGLD